MGNPITNNLPDEVDSLLQDVAQIYGGFDYFTVMRFSKLCTKDDIRKLKKIAKFFNDREGEVTKRQINYYSAKVVMIVKERMKRQPSTGWSFR